VTPRLLEAIGVDGCRGGWIAACGYDDGSTELQLFADIGELAGWREGAWDEPPVAIDMPIGLPEDVEPRSCDREARELLGRRWPCVFHGASSFDEARRLAAARGGRAISRQSFGIMPRVRELDRFSIFDCACQDWLFEAHPEVSLAELAGTPLPEPKRRRRGREQRLGLLRAGFPDIWRRIGERRGGAAADDALDAYAALWTALRLARGDARALGGGERDRAGLVMRIVV
jgi:predicted RNase H-like nuclease